MKELFWDVVCEAHFELSHCNFGFLSWLFLHQIFFLISLSRDSGMGVLHIGASANASKNGSIPLEVNVVGNTIIIKIP